jgi:hypothetical protein
MEKISHSAHSMYTHLREITRIQSHLRVRESRHRHTAESNSLRVNVRHTSRPHFALSFSKENLTSHSPPPKVYSAIQLFIVIAVGVAQVRTNFDLPIAGHLSFAASTTTKFRTPSSSSSRSSSFGTCFRATPKQAGWGCEPSCRLALPLSTRKRLGEIFAVGRRDPSDLLRS